MSSPRRVLGTVAVLGLVMAFQLDAPEFVSWMIAVVAVLLILLPVEKTRD